MRPLIAFFVFIYLSGSSHGHFHIFIPEKASYQKDEIVTLNFKFGHPFECELQDALKPDKVFVISPKGKKTEITETFKPIKEKIGTNEITTFQGNFEPNERGDYIVIALSQPIYLPSEKIYIQDTVKVVIHIQTQNNWDTGPNTEFELLPLSRPYGLLPGMVSRFQVVVQGNQITMPEKGWRFEIEKWNANPPKVLPPEELITFTAKADTNGIVLFSIPDFGWWSITTESKEVAFIKEEKKSVIKKRSTFWFFVDQPKVKAP